MVGSAVILADDHSVTFDTHVDFSTLQTFAVREAKVASERPELSNELFVRLISDAVREQLAKKLPDDVKKLLSQYPPKKKKK
jgi:hypothetical protein